MGLRVGQRLGSVTCDTEVIVVRAPQGDVEVTCGGMALMPAPAERDGEGAADGEPTLLGKRYVHDASGLELLCTKGGVGTLRVEGEPLGIKQAKNLPSSD